MGRRPDLRQPDRSRRRADARQEGVERRSGARCGEAVAVPGDGVHHDVPPGPVARVPRRHHVDPRGRVDVRHVEPPGDEALERCDGGRPGAGGAVRPDDRDARRAGVEPLRLRPDHRLRHAAVAALEDGAALVDEEVVADVVPAVRAHVVGVDAADDPGRIRARRGRGGVGVVDEHHLELGRVGRRGTPDRLVGVPSRARDDPRPGGERRDHRPRRRCRHARAGDEGDLEAVDVTVPVKADAPRRPGPHGSLLRERHPPRPPATRAPGLEADAAVALPADADHLEGAARFHRMPERVGEVRLRLKAAPHHPPGRPGPRRARREPPPPYMPLDRPCPQGIIGPPTKACAIRR